MSTERDEIARNLSSLEASIKEALLRSGRPLDSVVLLGVSKKQSIQKLQAFIDLFEERGKVAVFGENYLQEFERKKGVLHGKMSAHFIGVLQSNKIKDIVGDFEVIESVASPKHAVLISKAAESLGKVQDIFLQINISSDDAKAGMGLEEASKFISDELPKLSHAALRGFMTITKFYENPEDARPDFAALRRFRDEIGKRYGLKLELSMGMSQDFEIAIEEGATVVRIGTALFGER